MAEGEPGAGADRGAAEEWSVGTALEETERFVKGLRLPTQRPPEDLGQEYEFPANAATLHSVELGTLQLRLTGWYTYLLQSLGRVETELGALRQVFDISLGTAMERVQTQMIAEGAPKVIAREILRARAIREDDKVSRVARLILTKEALVTRLETQAKIYHEQLTRLSREQSRREAEIRVA